MKKLRFIISLIYYLQVPYIFASREGPPYEDRPESVKAFNDQHLLPVYTADSKYCVGTCHDLSRQCKHCDEKKLKADYQQKLLEVKLLELHNVELGTKIIAHTNLPAALIHIITGYIDDHSSFIESRDAKRVQDQKKNSARANKIRSLIFFGGLAGVGALVIKNIRQKK